MRKLAAAPVINSGADNKKKKNVSSVLNMRVEERPRVAWHAAPRRGGGPGWGRGAAPL